MNVLSEINSILSMNGIVDLHVLLTCVNILVPDGCDVGHPDGMSGCEGRNNVVECVVVRMYVNFNILV
jgi:hypothetical protein